MLCTSNPLVYDCFMQPLFHNDRFDPLTNMTQHACSESVSRPIDLALATTTVSGITSRPRILLALTTLSSSFGSATAILVTSHTRSHTSSIMGPLALSTDTQGTAPALKEERCIC